MREFATEFDYPGMVAFHKVKAPGILNDVPSAFHLELTGFFVGQYDPTKSVFPFTDALGQKKPTVPSSRGTT